MAQKYREHQGVGRVAFLNRRGYFSAGTTAAGLRANTVYRLSIGKSFANNDFGLRS